jgi:DNA topoisomerase-1
MSIAQKLYENGHITYMRTDSTSLSEEALKACQDFITKNYGKKYHNKKNYVSKSKNAQEAHEAVRPTHIENPDIQGTTEEKKLYSLIWKRTVASQMSAAEVSINNIFIEITHNKVIPYYFLAVNESIIFEGYLKVYNIKSEDDEDLQSSNTNFKKGDKLNYEQIDSKQEYPKSIGRYNEANLVKKLEDLGIGRPSTYASIISKIQERKYVEKCNLDGEEKEINVCCMKPNKGLKWTKSKTTLGKEKQKLVPTSIGKIVTEYLDNNFENIMEYKFTAKLENDLDKIVDGDKKWDKVLQKFWDELGPKIEKLLKENKAKNNGKFLGTLPETNTEIYATVARYGPVVKMVNGKDIKYAPINEPLTIDKITLDDALKLFEYPKTIGRHKDIEININKGKFGLYVKYNGKNYPLKDNNLDLKSIIQIIEDKNKDLINEFTINKKIYQIRNGKYGPYISYNLGKKIKFVSIPKNKDANALNENDVKKLIS